MAVLAKQDADFSFAFHFSVFWSWFGVGLLSVWRPPRRVRARWAPTGNQTKFGGASRAAVAQLSLHAGLPVGYLIPGPGGGAYRWPSRVLVLCWSPVSRPIP